MCGNVGMYASGIPVGMLVDAKGAKPGVLFGSLMLGAGYYSLHRGEDRRSKSHIENANVPKRMRLGPDLLLLLGCASSCS